MLKNHIKKIAFVLFLIILSAFIFYLISPKYSADSLRYVYAGQQLLSIFFDNLDNPILVGKLRMM